ncbi:MAG: hypothetical protein J7L15_04545 [Clostridiales bacterium]|nr:hypothetical protein [Clostridiales bacterium]
MKIDNPNMFKYLQSLDNNMYNAYLKYKENSIQLKAESVDMYFFLQERKLLSEFGRILVQKNLSKTQNSFNSSCIKVLFNSIEGFGTYPVFVKYTQYLKEFNKHYTL